MYTSGNTDYDVEVTFGENARVYYSCAATLNGDFWVLGGGPDKYIRQVTMNIQLLGNISCSDEQDRWMSTESCW